MANIKTDVKGNTLTIVIDLSKAAVDAAKPSSTGKTKLIASTGGAIAINGPVDGLKLAINATIPNE